MRGRPATPCRFCGIRARKRAQRCRYCGRHQYPQDYVAHPRPPAQRPLQVLAYRKDHPGLTLQSIATEFMVTRERVRQILAKAHIPTTRSPQHPAFSCQECQRPMRAARSRTGLPILTCPECNTRKRWTTRQCVTCGAPVRRSVKRLAWRATSATAIRAGYTGRVFCNPHCFGTWIGKHFGMGNLVARQHNIALRKRLAAERTQCRNGHPWPENLAYWLRHGELKRACRACANTAWKALRIRRTLERVS